MADVIDIASHRKKKPPPTLREIVDFCITDVMINWERFAKANKLNDFVQQGLGIYANPSVNYLANRDKVAEVEDKIGLLPVVWGPGVKANTQLGWRAGCRFDDLLVETPDMMSELYARSFNMLMFLKIRREMVVLNQPQV